MLTIHLITNMFRLKIQSTSDVITNSSSEIFVVKTGTFSISEIKELVQVVGEMCAKAYDENHEANYKKDWEQLEKEDLDGYSGMGGELEVRSGREEYEYRSRWVNNYTFEDFLEEEGLEEEDIEQYVWIDIDHSRRGTIKYILENFEIFEHEIC